jgi:hypothetical protein
LFLEALKINYKIKESDFTRNRKQSFAGTILFMVNRITKSLAIEIENFVAYCNENCLDADFQPLFTKSAFVQYRKKINHKVFKRLSSALLDEFYTDNDEAVKLWKGHRLLAVDGSRLTLPQNNELLKYFGETINQNSTCVIQGRVSVLYDVLNNYALYSTLSPLVIGENKLAIEHLKCCKKNDLIIFDRGYPGFPLIYQLNKKKIDFVIRAKQSFSKITKSFSESEATSLLIEIYPGQNKNFINLPFTKKAKMLIRLVKATLDSGEHEILITSLKDESKYPNEIFKDLYFERLKVETYYDELKNKLKIEHFSGYSKQAILQDFEATIFVSNLQTLIVTELNEELEHKKKYRYKVNNAISYGLLKNKVVSIFFNSDPENLIEDLKATFKKHLVPIRPNRSLPRKTMKFKRRRKPIVPKNQKDTF